MTLRWLATLAVAALVSSGFVSTAFSASAEDTAPKVDTAAPAASDYWDHWSRWHFSAADRAAFLDAKIAALHAGLGLTADQEKLWPPVEAAIRNFAKVMETQRQAFREAKRPIDLMSLLQTRSANLIARGEALKKIADAQKSLYDTLTDAQKNRLPVLARAIFHPRFGRGMMGIGSGMMGRGMMGYGRGMMGRGQGMGPGLMNDRGMMNDGADHEDGDDSEQ
jgi:zinc resistance-associated protein